MIVASIIFMISCYFIANFIYVPVLTGVATYFHGSDEAIKATMTFYQIGGVITCIIAGLFADFVGKKNFVVAGLILGTIGSITCFLSNSIEMLVVGRTIQGLGATSGFMMGFAVAVDLFETKRVIEIFALNGIIIAIICVVAPTIGGLLDSTFSWRGPFLVMPFVFLGATVACFYGLPAKANVRTSAVALAENLKEFGIIVTNLRYLSYALINSFFLASLAFSLSFLPFYYKSLGFSGNQIGLLIGTVMFLPFGVASILSPKLYNRIGVDNSIKSGMYVCATAAMALLFNAYILNDYLPLTFGLIGLFFCGFGSIYSGTIAESLRVFKNATTKASSFRTITLAICSMAGAYVAQHFNDNNLVDLGFTYLIISSLAIAMFSLRGRASNNL
jgi:MFS transporter, DHA1 family, multidrug resistance protein